MLESLFFNKFARLWQYILRFDKHVTRSKAFQNNSV